MFEAYTAFLKGRLPKSVPAHITRDVDAELNNTSIGLFQFSSKLQEMLPNKDDEEIQKLLYKISWIYAAVEYLAGAVVGASYDVRKETPDGRTHTINSHPVSKLISNPNPYMSPEYLLAFVVYWLCISDKGAFWYLAPNRDNPDQIDEIWPIDSNRVTPIRGRNHFVRYFEYMSGGQGTTRPEKPLKINPNHVVWFRHPDPSNMWGSLPPLLAALTPAQIDSGISSREHSFYTTGKGVPLSIVSLDPAMSKPDFQMAKEEIRKDWEERGSTVAITRGGSVDIKTLGFTQQQLEILAAQELNRDKIDTIFLGMPLHGINMSNGDALKETNKIIVENKVWPLVKSLAGWINNGLVERFYAEEGVRFFFRDVRTTDKALEIQERAVDARWSTINDMRERLGMPTLEIRGMEGTDGKTPYGDLPVSLATNVAFLSGYYELNLIGGNGMGSDVTEEPSEPGVGHLPGSEAPSAVVRDEAGNANPDPNLKAVAFAAELKQFRKVWRKNPTKAALFEFRAAEDELIRDLFNNMVLPPEEYEEFLTEMIQSYA